MELFKKHYDKVATQRTNFETMLAVLQKTDDMYQRIELAEYALHYAVLNNTGYFTSSVLEKVFTDYAKSLKVNLSGIKHKPNSFLHILTEGYGTGGHTRVVERWIENAPITQSHSVVILKHNGAILETLAKNIANKNGEFIIFDTSLNLKDRALKLRKLAMGYEYIILHTHMDDATAVVAFGTEDFTRPVLFYNHANHLFWIGKSITDLLLDLMHDDGITQKRRKIFNTYCLGIPSKKIQLIDANKTASRKKFNLPLDKKIIITAGSAFKFKPIDDENLLDLIKQIIDDKCVCYAIGIPQNDKAWSKAKEESGDKIVPLGMIKFNSGYMDYIKSADLYLDSYPVGGGTTSIDAISVGVPTLFLKTALLQLDCLRKTNGYCFTKDDFIKKAKKILSDKKFSQEILNDERQSLIKYQSIEAWNEKIENLLKIAPKTHKVQDLSGKKDFCEIDDICVLNNVMHNENFMTKCQTMSEYDIQNGFVYKKIGVDWLLSIEKRRKINGVKTRIIRLFNIPFVKWVKNHI